MATNFPVLRKDHSLVGRNNLPVILAIRGFKGKLPDPLARLKRDSPLDEYEPEQLVRELEGILGTKASQILEVADVAACENPVEVPKEILLAGLHAAILEANAHGQPRGTALREKRGASPTPRDPEAGHSKAGSSTEEPEGKRVSDLSCCYFARHLVSVIKPCCGCLQVGLVICSKWPSWCPLSVKAGILCEVLAAVDL